MNLAEGSSTAEAHACAGGLLQCEREPRNSTHSSLITSYWTCTSSFAVVIKSYLCRSVLLMFCPARGVLPGNKLCIVMEFAPAGDLSSFLKAAAASKLPLPEATVWQIFLQLCQGMQVGSKVVRALLDVQD